MTSHATENSTDRNLSANIAFTPSAARKFPVLVVTDAGRVRLGAQSPLFRRATVDKGDVRLGAQGPAFRHIRDLAKVRLGAQSPLFR